MFDHKARIENGYCVECGAQLQEGYRYDEMFHYPLAWEHNDPKLYALHFWLLVMSFNIRLFTLKKRMLI